MTTRAAKKRKAAKAAEAAQPRAALPEFQVGVCNSPMRLPIAPQETLAERLSRADSGELHWTVTLLAAIRGVAVAVYTVVGISAAMFAWGMHIRGRFQANSYTMLGACFASYSFVLYRNVRLLAPEPNRCLMGRHPNALAWNLAELSFASYAAHAATLAVSALLVFPTSPLVLLFMFPAATLMFFYVRTFVDDTSTVGAMRGLGRLSLTMPFVVFPLYAVSFLLLGLVFLTTQDEPLAIDTRLLSAAVLIIFAVIACVPYGAMILARRGGRPRRYAGERVPAVAAHALVTAASDLLFWTFIVMATSPLK